MVPLRSHLLRWLLVPLFILWVIGFRVSYLRSLEQANQGYDRTLLGSALAIAERVQIRDGEITVDIPNAALEMLETGFQDRLFYRVSCLDPKMVVTGYDDLPVPERFPKGDKPVFYETVYRDKPLRLVALLRPVYDSQVRGPMLIQIGETMDARQSLSRKILIDAVVTQLLLIIVAAALITYGVKRGLQPLLRIRNEIKARDETDLTPIDRQAVPREVVPLIDAINTHTERQRQLNEAHRQFIADASHQLKTPLTTLKTQAALALRQTDASASRAIVQEIHDSTDATSRVIQQLLSLARSEPGHTLSTEYVDLAEVARETALELITPALAKSIDLGFEGEDRVLVVGNRVLLHELVSNLVDNAIRYTPDCGRITVSVRGEVAGASLTVRRQWTRDSGIGAGKCLQALLPHFRSAQQRLRPGFAHCQANMRPSWRADGTR